MALGAVLLVGSGRVARTGWSSDRVWVGCEWVVCIPGGAISVAYAPIPQRPGNAWWAALGVPGGRVRRGRWGLGVRLPGGLAVLCGVVGLVAVLFVGCVGQVDA